MSDYKVSGNPGLAKWVLLSLSAVLFVFPVICSVSVDSFRINYYQGYLYLGFATALFVSAKFSVIAQQVDRTRSGRFLLAFFLVYLVAWLATGTPAPFIDRFVLLLGAVALYLALIELYGRDESLFLDFFQIKFLVVIAISVFFLLFLFFVQDPELKFAVKGHPPIYRHLRHFNYELFFIFPLLILLLKDRLNSLFLLGGLLILSFLAIWSAGRGMFVALLVALFFAAIRFWRSPPLKLMATIIAVFVVAFIILVISDNAYILNNTLGWTFERDTLNGISANRLLIWQRSLSSFLALEDLWVQLFGFGPDAFARMGVFKAGVTQPHNAPVQILLEFGVVGFVLFVLLGVVLIYRALFLIVKSQNDVDVLAAATLIGALAFSMFDGIFYHAVAFTMMVILISFVNFRFAKFRMAENIRTDISVPSAAY